MTRPTSTFPAVQFAVSVDKDEYREFVWVQQVGRWPRRSYFSGERSFPFGANLGLGSNGKQDYPVSDEEIPCTMNFVVKNVVDK